MNQHYTKFFATALMALGTLAGHAQDIAYLNANNVKAGIPTGGILYYISDTLSPSASDSTKALFEVPKGSGIKAIFSSSLWMGGVDAGNNLYCSAQRYIADDFFDGPLGQTVNLGYRNYYKRVFKVTKQQLSTHINLPTPVPNGQIDPDILLWPGKGNPHVLAAYGVNITDDLAPFLDVYPDGIYNPTMGDLPAICGEEAVFFVFNDYNGPMAQTGQALGVEVRGLAEVFVDDNILLPYEKRALNNTVFVHYEIQNKTNLDYYNFYISQYEDIDLGCWNDDRIGCDTTRDLMFGYNATYDFSCTGTLGYANKTAAQGLKFLNNNLGAFGYFQNDPSPLGDPATGVEYYNRMQGKWNDGRAYSWGGYGYEDPLFAVPTTYLFPGDPNNTVDWSEVNTHGSGGPVTSGGDRRMYGSTKPMTFNGGETKTFDLAYFVSYDSSMLGVEARRYIVDTLKRDADIIQSFYNNNILPCRAAQQPVGINNLEELAEIELFPNPANDIINVSSTQQISSLTLLDIQGNQLITQAVNSNKTVLDVAKLAKGIYLLQLQVGNSTATRKVAVK